MPGLSDLIKKDDDVETSNSAAQFDHRGATRSAAINLFSLPTFPPTFDLAAGGFRLRRLHPGDAAALARASQDEESLRWADPTGLTEATAAAEIADADELWAAGRAARFAIVPADGNRLLGTINLTFYGPQRASIGFGLAAEARGQGIAAAALRLLSDWAFATFDDLARLELWILPGNERSLRVAEKAGFKCEGVLRTRHQFGSELRDVVSYSRLPSDPR
jgi:[ribosomal protein S5]-alanine N-acetyltransferase